MIGPDARAWPAVALRRDQRRDQPDRHRHAADAAHRPHARADGRRPGADVYRHAAERRAHRAATSDSGAAGRGPGGCRGCGAGAAGADHDADATVPATPAGDTGARDGGAAGRAPTGAMCRRRYRPHRRLRLWERCRRRGSGTVPPAPTVRRRAAGNAAGAAPPAGVPPRDPNVAPSGAAGVPPAPAAQVTITAPQELRTAGGPYTVPLAVANASRLSMVTLTVTFNPAVLRVRNVQEGTFMRQGGVTATFTPRIDIAAGRVDIAVARNGDQRGRVGLRAAGGAAVRRGRAWQLADSGERRREQSRRWRVAAVIRAGVGDGEVTR